MTIEKRLFEKYRQFISRQLKKYN